MEEFAELRKEIQCSMAALKKADELLNGKIEPLMTVEEVAAYWRCTNQHVYNLVNSNVLNAIKIGGSLRFKRADILSFGVDK